MLLGPSGQNIYPEEIEAKINNMPFVLESLVLQQEDNRLVALVCPDYNEVDASGMTKEQFKAHAQLTYRHISRYFNWYTDVVFTDRLAALAFHAVLKSHADYCESAKADDDRLCKAFVDFYTSYDVTSMPDYIDDLMIQYANYRADIQKVVLVGDRNACINVCNSTYGEGKWVEVSTARKPSAVKELPKVEMTEDERKKNIDEAIAELKGLI